MKNLLANKWVRWALILIAAAFAAWYFMEVNKRNKRREGWIKWITAQPDTDPWKAQIITKAATNGVTVEEQIRIDAYYLTPSNPFKPLL